MAGEYASIFLEACLNRPARRGPVRPTPVTVVATDGSQIYRDRDLDPLFFLLNVSQVGIQYGTRDEPLLSTTPRLRFQDDLSAHVDALLGTMTTELVSALRDEMERELLPDAARTAQVDGWPLVALADGMLIRWMIRGMNDEAAEDELIARYTEYLTAFRRDELPITTCCTLAFACRSQRYIGDKRTLQAKFFSKMFDRGQSVFRFLENM